VYNAFDQIVEKGNASNGRIDPSAPSRKLESPILGVGLDSLQRSLIGVCLKGLLCVNQCDKVSMCIGLVLKDGLNNGDRYGFKYFYGNIALLIKKIDFFFFFF
jgi:hypothetical protein